VVTGTVSCSSCHDPKRHARTARTSAAAYQAVRSHATRHRFCNVAWVPRLMRDLEDQIRLPLTHADAMGATCPHAVGRRSADDDMGAFAETFPGLPGITSETIAKALAVFERSRRSPPTRLFRPLDRR
jgi:cytochrome c peroxidase